MSNQRFDIERTTENEPGHPNTTWCQASTDNPGHKSELVIGLTIQVTAKGLTRSSTSFTFFFFVFL